MAVHQLKSWVNGNDISKKVFTRAHDLIIEDEIKRDRQRTHIT